MKLGGETDYWPGYVSVTTHLICTITVYLCTVNNSVLFVAVKHVQCSLDLQETYAEPIIIFYVLINVNICFATQPEILIKCT